MAESVSGVLHGNLITLDGPVPPLEGMRVRVYLEPVSEDDSKLATDVQARLWREWVERGPDGPIDEEGEPEFP